MYAYIYMSNCMKNKRLQMKNQVEKREKIVAYKNLSQVRAETNQQS